jgi:UDP-N-acetylglucosamine transferase subunit ALG13
MTAYSMKLSGFDAFAKAKGDVISRTGSGAVITLASVTIALLLAMSEFSYFQEVLTEHRVKIDTRPGDRNLTIAMDLSFFHLTCPGKSVRKSSILCSRTVL